MGVQQVQAEAAPQTAPQAAQPDALARFQQFEDVVALIRARRDMKLLVEVENYLRLARYSPGRIEFEPTDAAPTDFASRLAGALQRWTGARWGVSVVSNGGGQTISEERALHRSDLIGQALGHPLVKAVFEAFPGLSDENIRVVEETVQEDEMVVPIDPEDSDENWDPFDD